MVVLEVESEVLVCSFISCWPVHWLLVFVVWPPLLNLSLFFLFADHASDSLQDSNDGGPSSVQTKSSHPSKRQKSALPYRPSSAPLAAAACILVLSAAPLNKSSLGFNTRPQMVSQPHLLPWVWKTRFMLDRFVFLASSCFSLDGLILPSGFCLHSSRGH